MVCLGSEQRDHARLLIRPSNVSQHLAKSTTGALATVFASQEKKLAAAVKIQSVMRGSFSRKKHTEAQRRRSSTAKEQRQSFERSGDPEYGSAATDSDPTIWVGNVPGSAADSPEVLTGVLSSKFGKVLSVTVRRKEQDGKSWAVSACTWPVVSTSRTWGSTVQLAVNVDRYTR